MRRITDSRYGCSAYWISAEPEGVDVIIINGAGGAFLKVHVDVHKQYVLPIFLVSNGVPNIGKFWATIGVEAGYTLGISSRGGYEWVPVRRHGHTRIT